MVLILALCSTIVGAFVGGTVFVTPQRTYETDEQGSHRTTVIYTGLVIGGTAAILLASALPSHKNDPPGEIHD